MTQRHATWFYPLKEHRATKSFYMQTENLSRSALILFTKWKTFSMEQPKFGLFAINLSCISMPYHKYMYKNPFLLFTRKIVTRE